MEKRKMPKLCECCKTNYILKYANTKHCKNCSRYIHDYLMAGLYKLRRDTKKFLTKTYLDNIKEIKPK